MSNLRKIANQLANSGSLAHPANIGKLFRKNEYRIESGMYREALIFPNECVIKSSLSDERYYIKSLYREFEFINFMKDSPWGKHFPETHFVENEFVTLIVQEYVPNVGKLPKDIRPKGNDWIYNETTIQDHVYNLGEYLSIEDIHSRNYGWKYDHELEEYYPVFIDADFRTSSPTALNDSNKPSWAI